MGTPEKEMLIASNKSLAEYNLSRSAEFQEKKRGLVDIYEELKEINERIEAKSGKLSMFSECIYDGIHSYDFTCNFFIAEELTNKSNSEAILALLQAAASEIERETDVRNFQILGYTYIPFFHFPSY